MEIISKFFTKRTVVICCVAVIILGAVARVRYYLADISFWIDEAAVALNVLNKSFAELLQPLDYNQVAPVGFCILEKAAISLLGNNEFAFRLLPFVAGIVAIWLTFCFTRKAIGILPALLCAAQLSISTEILFFANCLKPYASDLTIAVGLMLLAWKDDPGGLSPRRLAALGLCGLLAVWFSFPAIFILGGIGTLWMVDWIRFKNRRLFLWYCTVILLWLASFYLHFQFLQSQTHSEGILDFWANSFMPFPPKNFDDLKFFIVELPRVFRNCIWTSDQIVAVVLFGAGCLLLWRNHRRLLVLTIIPLLLNLFASALHKYPFGGRMLQYGALNLFIPIAVTLDYLLAWGSKMKWVRVVAILLIIANLGEPAVNTAKGIFIPRKREQMKQLVAFLVDHPARISSYFAHQPGYSNFSYYANRYRLNIAGLTLSPTLDKTKLDHYPPELASLHGDIWLIFGHAKQHRKIDYEKYYVQSAQMRARLVEKFTDVGVAAYLFRFD